MGARPAAWGDVTLRVQVRPSCGLHIPLEPVVVLARLENLTDTERYFGVPATGGLAGSIGLTVLDAEGEKVAARVAQAKKRQPSGHRLFGAVVLPPKGQSPWYATVTDSLFAFAKTGDYVVRATVRDWMGRGDGSGKADALPLVAEASAKYNIELATEADHRLLPARLAWWHLYGRRWPNDRPPPDWARLWEVPAARRALTKRAGKLLAGLGIEPALPYLAQFAYGEQYPWAFEGIRRVASPHTRRILEILARSRSAGTSAAAKKELARMDGDDLHRQQ